jgi:hypothetical protein
MTAAKRRRREAAVVSHAGLGSNHFVLNGFERRLEGRAAPFTASSV